MRQSVLFVLGVLVAAVALAQAPVQSIRDVTPANADAFRAWARAAPSAQTQPFLDELRGLERPQRQRILRALFPSLRNRQLQGTGSAARLGGPFAIQYDNYPVSPATIIDAFGGYLGNQFDTGLPAGTNTINTVQFLPIPLVGSTPVELGFFGPVSAGVAPPLGTRAGGSAAFPPTLQTVMLVTPVSGLTGSFQAGLLQAGFQPPAAIGGLPVYLGVTGYAYTNSGPVAGFGPADSLHLMFVTASGAHSAIANSVFRNGVFRVSGVTIPVELTNFSVD